MQYILILEIVEGEIWEDDKYSTLYLKPSKKSILKISKTFLTILAYVDMSIVLVLLMFMVSLILLETSFN